MPADIHFKNRRGYPQCGAVGGEAVWDAGSVTCAACIATMAAGPRTGTDIPTDPWTLAHHRGIARRTQAIPHGSRYEVLRAFEDAPRSTCAHCGMVCVDNGWDDEPHWAHAVGGYTYDHGAEPTTVTPGPVPKPKRGHAAMRPESEPAWWEAGSLMVYNHWEAEVEQGMPRGSCVRHPDTGDWYALRETAGEPFLALHDDGQGLDVVPCPGTHPEDAPEAPEPPSVFRLADSVSIRREDLEHQPSLLSMIYADMERPGSVDWSALDRDDPPPTGVEDFKSMLRGEGVAHPPDPDDLRKAVNRALFATYEPVGLILHPIEHARVGIDPDDPESIEAAKDIARAFDVPFWVMGIPGYDPPPPTPRQRVERFLRALPRRLLTRLPGVRYRGPRETGEGWMNDAPAEPRAWRWGVHVGNYRIGTEPHDPWTCGDPECTEAHP